MTRCLHYMRSVMLRSTCSRTRDAKKVETVSKAMAHGLQTADQELAQRVKDAHKDTTRTVVSLKTITDAAARKDARSVLTAVMVSPA